MRFLPFILLSVLAVLHVRGQGYFMEFLTTDDGLPADQITDIKQDSSGFLWLLSYKGVTRYDGTDFRQYPTQVLGNEEFAGNSGRKLFCDKAGGIWLTTYSGAILAYDPLQDAFLVKNDSATRLPAPAYSYYWDNEGVYWFGTAGSGFIKWDRQTGRLRQYLANTHPDSLSDNIISSIYPVNDTLLNLTTTKGSNLFNPATGRFYRLWFASSDKESYKHNVIRHSLTEGSRTYMATYHGLHIINEDSREIEHLTDATINRSTINHNSLWEMAADLSGKIWITTYGGGVNILDPTSGRFTYLTTENSDLPENNLQGVFKDREGNIWLRTATSGLVKIDFRKQWVRQFDFEKYGWPVMTTGKLGKDSVLWIGTNGGGLIRYDLENNSFIRYVHDPDNPESLGYNHITSLDLDEAGRIWLATGGEGMDMLDPVSGKFTHYPYAPEDKGVSNAALSFIKCDRNYVYYVTFGNGFGVYDNETHTFVSYQSNNDTGTTCDIRYTNMIMTDHKNNVWVASPDGLIMQTAGQNTFRDMLSPGMVEVPLLSTDIVFIGQHQKGNYILMNRSGELMEFSLSQEDEMEMGTVYPAGKTGRTNVLHYSDTEIWTMSDTGLSQIDLATGIEKKYSRVDGLLGKEFYQLPGTPAIPVMLASMDGLNLLNISSPPRPSALPVSVFQEFSVLNRPVAIGRKDSLHGLLLSAHLNYTKRVDLNYSHKEFSIAFGALQFYAPHAASFRYRLKGFRDEWVESGRVNRVSYTNLDPGEYTFEVQAGIIPEEWGPVKSLLIRIAPPFWMTWWFVTIFALLCMGVLYLFHRNRIQKAVALANIRTQIAQDLHDDIGSSLTKISLYSNLMEEGKNEKIASQISLLSREVISQMSDIVWSVDQKNDSVNDLIVRMRQFAYEILSEAGVQVDLQVSNTERHVQLNPLVRQNLYLIFKEAVNNIHKHSGAGNVRIRIWHQQNMVAMEIEDDGKGIDETPGMPENNKHYPLNSGNGLGNMRKRAERIGAVFTIRSDKSGTTILVHKPT